MLHALAAAHSTRSICWLHTVRNPESEAFATEVATLIDSLPHARRYVFYTQTQGHMDQSTTAALGLPVGASAYLCGPTQFMTETRDSLVATGVEPADIHVNCLAPFQRSTRASSTEARASRPIHRPARRDRAIDHVRAQRTHGQLVIRLPQHPRPRRSPRSTNAFRLPERRLSRVRDRDRCRDDDICPAAAVYRFRRSGKPTLRRCSTRTSGSPAGTTVRCQRRGTGNRSTRRCPVAGRSHHRGWSARKRRRWRAPR
jgi:hypothetical protein